MGKPTALPEWDTTKVNVVEPDATHKAQGWLAPGGVPEKPPFQTFNYLQNNIYDWLKYINETILNASYPAFTAADQGVTGDSNTINYYVDQAAGSDEVVHLAHNSGAATTTFTLTTDEILTENIVLDFDYGATMDGTGTITIYSPANIVAGDAQRIFGPSITVKFTVNTGDRSVGWWGADGVGDEESLLNKCAGSVVGGTVLIPFSTFNVPNASQTSADCNGAVLKGNNTTITGDIGNFPLRKGIIKGGGTGFGNDNPTEWAAFHPTIVRDQLKKFIYHSNANAYSVIVPSAKNKYVLIGLLNNSTTTTGSLSVTSSDITSWRIASIRNVVAAPAGYTTSSAQSGVWVLTDLVEGITYDDGTAYSYERTSTSGGYSEYTITVPSDGFFSVSFVRRSTTSADVDITLDTVAIGTAVDTSTAGADDVYTINYVTKPGSHVIRITNNTTSPLRVVGINYAELRDQRTDVDLDTFGAYRLTTWPAPISSVSENDLAIFDADADLWGNGYHGGESSIVSVFNLDGVATSLGLAEFKICKDIEMIQDYTVDWSAEGGGSFDMQKEHIFKLGGYYLKTTVTGDATDNAFYSTLVGISDDFDELVFPQYLDFSGDIADASYYLFKTNMAEYRNSSNDQRVRIEHTQFNQNAGLSGPFIVASTPSGYHKYYNAWVSRGERKILNLAMVNSITVE